MNACVKLAWCLVYEVQHYPQATDSLEHMAV